MPKYLIRARDLRTEEVIVEKEVEASDDAQATDEAHAFLRETRREVSGGAWLADVLGMVIRIEDK